MSDLPPLHPVQPATKGACFQCKHFMGLSAGTSTSGLCGYPGAEHVRARPELGCAYWTLHPHRSPDIKTSEAWELQHGRPIRGFNDQLRPKKWPTPLYARRIRDLYGAAPGPETKTLTWEIARLQDVLYRVHVALSAQADGMPHSAVRANLVELAKLLGQEPGVSEAIEREAKKSKHKY